MSEKLNPCPWCGRESRHHEDCAFYPGSLSEMREKMADRIEKLERVRAVAHKILPHYESGTVHESDQNEFWAKELKIALDACEVGE